MSLYCDKIVGWVVQIVQKERIKSSLVKIQMRLLYFSTESQQKTIALYIVKVW